MLKWKSIIKDLWFWSKTIFFICIFLIVLFLGDIDGEDGMHDEQASFYENAPDCYPSC